MSTNSKLADNIIAWIQHFLNAELYKAQLKLAYSRNTHTEELHICKPFTELVFKISTIIIVQKWNFHFLDKQAEFTCN